MARDLDITRDLGEQRDLGVPSHGTTPLHLSGGSSTFLFPLPLHI
jgi:hypothetical protein